MSNIGSSWKNANVELPKCNTPVLGLIEKGEEVRDIKILWLFETWKDEHQICYAWSATPDKIRRIAGRVTEWMPCPKCLLV